MATAKKEKSPFAVKKTAKKKLGSSLAEVMPTKPVQNAVDEFVDLKSQIKDLEEQLGEAKTKKMPDQLSENLIQFFKPDSGWNTIDCEWLRFADQIYIFDLLKLEGKLLSNLCYRDRYKKLKEFSFISPEIKILPIYKTANQCLKYIEQDDDTIEGLVFKALDTRGWSNTGIVRCRK